MIKARIRRVIQRYNDNKNSAKLLLKWAGIAIGIGILFVFMLPVIIFLAAVIGILILVSLLYKKRKRSESNNLIDLISSIIFSRIWNNYLSARTIISTTALVAGQSTKKSYVLDAVQSLRKKLMRKYHPAISLSLFLNKI
jgi:NADH:ubiquinone oxidoreductase subunit 6 (subunit J)